MKNCICSFVCFIVAFALAGCGGVVTQSTGEPDPSADPNAPAQVDPIGTGGASFQGGPVSAGGGLYPGDLDAGTPTGTGGNVGAGGATSTGGNVGTGGTTSTGGNTASGGTSSIGSCLPWNTAKCVQLNCQSGTVCGCMADGQYACIDPGNTGDAGAGGSAGDGGNVGTGGNTNEADAQALCQPGALTDCNCNAPSVGWSICAADGKSWGACCCTQVLANGSCAAALVGDAGANVATVTFDLASNPVSGTLTKKTQNAPALGITITADHDVDLSELDLQGQASIGSCSFGDSCSRSAFSQRVTSIGLFDGTTQVGLAAAPDMVTGIVQIKQMTLHIAAGTTKTLVAKVSLSSTASATAPYDTFAIGLTIGNWTNTWGHQMTLVIGQSLFDQVGASPHVVQTILNSGTLTIEKSAIPYSSNIVGGKDFWVPFVQYKATAQYEAITIDRLSLYMSTLSNVYQADNADFAMVAVASNGVVHGMGILPVTGPTDIDLIGNSIVVPKDGSILFQLWGKMAPVQASSSVNGATRGVARSGHAPSLGITGNLVTGEWDVNYTGMLNVRSNGNVSGERLYVPWTQNGTEGNVMFLRKTMPIVTKQALSSNTLANIDQDLIKFQVAADSAGSIALKQITFSFWKTAGVTLSNFRMRRGYADLDVVNGFAITDGSTGADLSTGSLATGIVTGTTGTIVFASKPLMEDDISGSGNMYTLHATVTGAHAGSYVNAQFLRETVGDAVTGSLTNAMVSPFVANPNVFNIHGQNGLFYTGTFVWSDLSEIPHSPALGTDGGSIDWINDALIEDLSQSQTLSM